MINIYVVRFLMISLIKIKRNRFLCSVFKNPIKFNFASENKNFFLLWGWRGAGCDEDGRKKLTVNEQQIYNCLFVFFEIYTKRFFLFSEGSLHSMQCKFLLLLQK